MLMNGSGNCALVHEFWSLSFVFVFISALCFSFLEVMGAKDRTFAPRRFHRLRW